MQVPQPTMSAAMARGASWPTLLAAGPVLLVAGLLGGPRAVLGAALGLLVTVTFFGLGLALSVLTARRRPGAVMAVALTSYAVKVVALGLFLWAFRSTTAFDTRAFAMAALAAAAVWLAAEVSAFLRARVSSVDPTPRGVR